MGQLLAGILLDPSVLGAALPDGHHRRQLQKLRDSGRRNIWDRETGIGMTRRNEGLRHEGHRGILRMQNERRAPMILACPQFALPVTAPTTQHDADDPLLTDLSGGTG